MSSHCPDSCRHSRARRPVMLALLLSLSLLSACSTQKAVYWPVCQPEAACKPAGTVVLLPQKNGAPSAVIVESASGTGLLSAPYQTAEANVQGSIQIAATTAEAVAKRYPWLLSLRPPEPQNLTVYFTSNKPHLTAESEAEIQTLLAFVAKWQGSEVTIVAHTDTKGSTALNDRLSLERAQTLRDRFIATGLRAELVDATGMGERDLAVLTADNVDEPRNRRAVISVR